MFEKWVLTSWRLSVMTKKSFWEGRTFLTSWKLSMSEIEEVDRSSGCYLCYNKGLSWYVGNNLLPCICICFQYRKGVRRMGVASSSAVSGDQTGEWCESFLHPSIPEVVRGAEMRERIISMGMLRRFTTCTTWKQPKKRTNLKPENG